MMMRIDSLWFFKILSVVRLTKHGKPHYGFYRKGMVRIIGVVFAILFFVFVYFGFVELTTDPESEAPQLREEVMMVGAGYGYRIFYGDRLFIQQEYIPALRGPQHFANPEDAQRTAELVIYKIIKGASPEITLDELKALNVVILEK